MIIKINFSSETTIYTQLKNQIIEGIATGKLRREESLPSIRQLAGDIGVNMHTVNKAYSQLKAEGYILIHKRKGVIVNADQIRKNEKYKALLEEKIRPIISESVCHGLNKEDFLKQCSLIFENIIPESKI